MAARSMARADPKDALPSAGVRVDPERSTMSAMRSADSGLPVKASTHAATIASDGRRSKARSSKLRSHLPRRSACPP
jgi:hypothetical protein